MRTRGVEDLHGAEVSASTFRETATTVDFHNIVIVGPRLHDYPCTVPFEGSNPVLVLEEDSLARGERLELAPVFLPPFHVSGEP